MAIASNNVRVYDLKDKLIREVKGAADDVIHFGNFVKAIREDTPLNAADADGQKSALLSHLGNIAWRTGRTINYNPKVGKIVGDDEAAALWGRSYRPALELDV
jgi:hypothetical protein